VLEPDQPSPWSQFLSQSYCPQEALMPSSGNSQKNGQCYGLWTSNLKLPTLLAHHKKKKFPPNIDSSHPFVALWLFWDALWVPFSNFTGTSPGDSSLCLRGSHPLVACFWWYKAKKQDCKGFSHCIDKGGLVWPVTIFPLVLVTDGRRKS
jgi:hypothetical protein